MMGKILLKVGARGSALSKIQTKDALDRLSSLLPELSFETVAFETPGDRDLTSSIRTAPADFFSRDLDDAVRSGAIDFAVHSAKDLTYPLPSPELDWFWLPWREDSRDCWALRTGETLASLSAPGVPPPVIGVSSDRREAYARTCFPHAVCKPIRGSIPSRLAQLDAGDFDAVLVAGAALNRLHLPDRVTEWIPLARLTPPDAQGVLAVTFRKGNPVMTALRAYFVKAVRFVGAGVGSEDLCTWGGVKDLRQAEVCLYDQLMDDHLLAFLPETAQRIFVGKRCGEHSMCQPEITELITRLARRGSRVVRLKGGDPGIFGRLTEEVEALEELGIPYTVRPGVSALAAATTGTGMLLTRRGVSRGFTALTPRAEGGGVAGVGKAERERLPLVLFMSVKIASRMAAQLMEEGWPAETPAAIVYNAGGEEEKILRLTLGTLQEENGQDAPGLILIGENAGTVYRRDLGALRGNRVLLTCSEALLEEGITAVTDFGGIPLSRPMIRLVPEPAARAAVSRIADFDWIVLTSPGAVRIFLRLLREEKVDLRHVPKLATCGPGCARELEAGGMTPDLVPTEDFSAEGMIRLMTKEIFSGTRVLRLRSEKAGPCVAEALRECGATVNDVTLYRNEDIVYEALPAFDIVFFASASAVESFVRHYGEEALQGKRITVLGKPTAAAVRRAGRTPDVLAAEATVRSAIFAARVSRA